MVNELLILGDSFCADRNETDWPVHLSKLLGLKLSGKGFGGNSWWTIRSYLEQRKAVNNSNTILVICHTIPSRIPNDYELPINTGLLSTQEIKDSPTTPAEQLNKLANDFYASKLFSFKFYEWAQQAWLKELDECNDYFKIIHVPGFSSVDLSAIHNGVVIRPSLDIPALRELSDKEMKDKNWMGRDSRHNHFCEHNNLKFAEAMAAIIKTIYSHSAGLRFFGNLDEWDFTERDFIPLKYFKKFH